MLTFVFSALALLAQSPGAPETPKDPGLVFHLTGDLESDRAQIEAANLTMEGFEATEHGIIGPGLRAGRKENAANQQARTRSFISEAKLGPVFCWEFWIRAEGAELHAEMTKDWATLVTQPSQAGLSPGAAALKLMAGSSFSRWMGPLVVDDVLAKGEWSHVAIAVDLQTTMTARFVVNGKELALRHPVPADDYRASGEAVWPVPVFLADALGEGVSLEFDEIRLYDRFVSTSELRGHFEWESAQELAESFAAQPFESGISTTSLQPGDWKWGPANQAIGHEDSVEWVPGQWSRDKPSSKPIPRTCHAVVSLGDGKLLMFGGELRDTDIGNMANGDDTWLYHIAEQRWERVGGGFTGRRGREVASAGGSFSIAPEPRCHQGIAFDPATGNAFLLSGWANENGSNITYPDAWTFNVNSNEWTRQDTIQEVPSITDVSPVLDEARNRFLFLTRDAVLSMEPAGGELEQHIYPAFVDESFAPITPRTQVQAMTWYDPDTELVLRFGGFDITPPEGERTKPLMDRTNSMMIYSAKHAAWVLRNTPQIAPSPRVRGAVAYDTKRHHSVLFGGITGGLDSRTNDLWTYETASNTWRELRAADGPTGGPGPRGGYFGMAYDEGLDVFVVPFGRQDANTFLDEVWRLALRPEANGTAVYTFRREGYYASASTELPNAWPEGLRLDWDWSGDKEPTFEVRVGEDDSNFGEWHTVPEKAASGGGDVPAGLYIQVRITLPPGASVTRLGFV